MSPAEMSTPAALNCRGRKNQAGEIGGARPGRMGQAEETKANGATGALVRNMTGGFGNVTGKATPRQCPEEN